MICNACQTKVVFAGAKIENVIQKYVDAFVTEMQGQFKNLV